MINILLLLLLSALCGFLGAWGGSGQILWRRVGIPVVLVAVALLVYHNPWFVFLMSLAGAYALGYGVPDPTDPKPSKLGAFFYKLTGGNKKLTSILTRGVCGLAKATAFLVIPILLGNWGYWAIASVLLVINSIAWGALITKEGTYKVKFPWMKEPRELLVEETMIYAVDALIGLSLIWKWGA